jgi:hypothetical protein
LDFAKQKQIFEINFWACLTAKSSADNAKELSTYEVSPGFPSFFKHALAGLPLCDEDLTTTPKCM